LEGSDCRSETGVSKAMTFEQWFASLGGGYDSYEDLFRECWANATESAAKVVDEMAEDQEREYEPTPAIQWTLNKAAEIRANK